MGKIYLVLTILGLAFSLTTFAQRPIVGPGDFVYPDPANRCPSGAQWCLRSPAFFERQPSKKQTTKCLITTCPSESFWEQVCRFNSVRRKICNWRLSCKATEDPNDCTTAEVICAGGRCPRTIGLPPVSTKMCPDTYSCRVKPPFDR